MRIAVGISGGVDSAAAALSLLEGGHDVIALTMRLIPGTDTSRAAAVTKSLGITHRILDFTDAFDRLILTPFAKAYAAGQTPSPCVQCNTFMKFGMLRDAALSEGCQAIATGHYVRTTIIDGHPALLRGSDPDKDQSYFLAQLSNAQLANAIFPLGNMLKSEVRALVASRGLLPPAQSESQDLCFISNAPFADFVAARFPSLRHPGWIITRDGTRLGRHTGAFQYTIGQRRGLGLGGGPWFVIGTDISANTVTVGRTEDLTCTKVRLSGLNWLIPPPQDATALRVRAQLRYLMRPRDASLINNGDSTATLIFDNPAPLAPPGQLAAAYIGERVVASGWIEP